MSGRFYRYVYGPVPSRRLGRSLGVDLVPFKTCTYDCIYCQLGQTTDKTIERKEYVAVEDIASELERKLATEPAPDYITLAGSGEPTLNSGIGGLIGRIRELTRIPTAILTNGSLIWKLEVQDALMEANLVIPSLDAGDNRLFKYVNRPHGEIVFEQMIDGLAEFTGRFSGKVWLEVFLLDGVTGIEAEVQKIAAMTKKINPARVQLNTVSRPPAEEYAVAVSKDRMEKLAGCFSGMVEVVGDYSQTPTSITQASNTARENIAALLSRRPCTLADIALSLNIHPTEATKYLDMLIRDGKILRVLLDGKYFFSAHEINDQREGETRQ
ncbi:MAG: radical SAM protein [Candidatus Sumerlaeota bacterium]|nr:radical SAM protein [Candidatus Sumerlaeota bacterium]